jgi:hypothetical protein
LTLLAKLANNPQRSIKLFFVGLAFFALGGCFIFYGYHHHHYWQILGLVLLGIGIFFSTWGYIGLFAQRLLQMFNRYPK